MLALRCYPPVMPRDADTGDMTEFGREVWAVIQRRGRYSQAAIGRRLNERTGWGPSRQAINHWLYGTRDVHRDFVPALVRAFDLTDEEERSLKELYFYGQGDSFSEGLRREAEELPGGARNAADLREGLGAAAEARAEYRTGEADDQRADQSRQT